MPVCGVQEKNIHFFVRAKGSWLSGLSLTQQPKRVALSLKGFKKSRPVRSWPAASLDGHLIAGSP